MKQSGLRLVGVDGVTDLASEVRAALATLAEEKDAAFILTRSGVRRIMADAHNPATFHLFSGDGACELNVLSPRWDAANRVLTFGGQIIKRYRRSSPNQEALLRAFEEQGWPYRIDDPLPFNHDIPPKLRLHDTIRWLNLKQESRILRFLGDGTGEGVCWKMIEANGPALHREPVADVRRAA
jgi:hypothetical protein